MCLPKLGASGMSKIADLGNINNAVRAAFVAQGTRLHRWCRGYGVDPHNARKALIGKWQGAKAEQLRRKIQIAAGLVK